MARVTVEDCVDKEKNRFKLVMLAAHRSRNISAGAPLTIERDNDKNPVVALREIAEETITVEETRESLLRSLQRHVDIDEPEEEDTLELMAGAIMAGEETDSRQIIAEAEPVEQGKPADSPAPAATAPDPGDEIVGEKITEAGDATEAGAESGDPEKSG